MKSVLISIQPKWCDLIASGKKTVEVRKTRPKLETPFKVYIYCTSSNIHECLMQNESGVKLIYACNYKTAIPCGGHIANGKVIGEFVCDDIDTIAVFNDRLYCVKNSQANKLKQMCLTIEEIKAYLGSKNQGYNWHISDLKIYGKPRELREFCTFDSESVQKCEHRVQSYFDGYCNSGCLKCGFYCSVKDDWCDKCKTKPITRPPQSWCYVKGGEGDG